MAKSSLSEKSDRQIHREVLLELEWDPTVDETEIGVEVKNGIVTLNGTVDSYGKKVNALEAVYRVSGILDVANEIQVKVPGDLSRTDTEIAQVVRQTLEWDTLVPHEKIRTTVTDGWVTLAGEVPFWLNRDEAEWVVRRLWGVRGVTNGITVTESAVDPKRLREKIEEALERRADREAGRIGIEIQDGVVTLTGIVHNWGEKRSVLGTVGCAQGVSKVEDRIVVDPYL